MAYTRYIYRFKDSIEYEFHYAGKYGAKGEKRSKKVKATPEQIEKQNQKNKENKVRRLIKANFKQNDLWLTLKFPKGTRKPPDEVKKLLGVFLESLRRKYKRRGSELKFIYRMEIGKQGGIHIHMICNDITDAFKLIQDTWKHGRVNFQCLYEDGEYEQLASYLVKQPDEEVGQQLSLFPEEDQKQFIKYSSSRNLIRPAPEKKKFTHYTVRKLIENGPTASEGFYIDQSSIRQGINNITGTSYLYYTEYRLRPPEKGRT